MLDIVLGVELGIETDILGLDIWVGIGPVGIGLAGIGLVGIRVVGIWAGGHWDGRRDGCRAAR